MSELAAALPLVAIIIGFVVIEVCRQRAILEAYRIASKTEEEDADA